MGKPQESYRSPHPLPEAFLGKYPSKQTQWERQSAEKMFAAELFMPASTEKNSNALIWASGADYDTKG